jgi:hypothetical protein
MAYFRQYASKIDNETINTPDEGFALNTPKPIKNIF